MNQALLDLLPEDSFSKQMERRFGHLRTYGGIQWGGSVNVGERSLEATGTKEFSSDYLSDLIDRLSERWRGNRR
jgi:hypothetical protein